MICPHCNKEIDIGNVSEANKNNVLNEITNETHCISSLCKKLNIKRSSMRYYINLLLAENKIFQERLENVAGRPTILKPKFALHELKEVEVKK